MIENNPRSIYNEAEKRSILPVIRVMLVDDSAVIRGMLTRIIETEPQLHVVSSASDGQKALTVLRARPVDVVVLDLEMPNMDGLTALPKLKETQPSVKIIIVSSLTRENAEIAMKAMRLGAEDYLSKPNTTSEMTSITAFRRDVVNKIKALGGYALEIDNLVESDAEFAVKNLDVPKSTQLLINSPRMTAEPSHGLVGGATRLSPSTLSSPSLRTSTTTPWVRPQSAPPKTELPNPIHQRPLQTKPPAQIKLRPLPSFFETNAIAIGSSTGGPQALFSMLADWPDALQQPIFITQHMPPTFTTILGEHITRISKRPAAEAIDGEIVKPGRIYIAPGDFHIYAEESGRDVVLRVRQTEPENFCRPSVDPMFRSLARVYRSKLLAIMLTGMGRDGLLGSKALVEEGGLLLAQDEASSVVWGMPGTVAHAGLCSALVPLTDINRVIKKLILRGES